MRQPHRATFTLIGYLLFFVMVCFVATIAILSYSLFSSLYPENDRIVALLTAIVLLVLALICTAIDILRRKIMVERPVKIIINATEKIKSGNFNVDLKPLHTYGKYDDYDIIIENIKSMTNELSKNEVLKTDFIANVSHEIKTPLTIIQNYAMMLSSKKITDSEKEEYCKILVSTSKRLASLITNILKLNKLENQQLTPEKLPFDLSEQLREIIIQYEELFEKKDLELECDIDDLQIISDQSLLEIIWNNLISNAIKFTKETGKIKITLKRVESFAVVTITDNGCGISEETGKHIFEKFYQGDSSHSQEGNGLGLALVKKVIDIIGGEITVESRLGEGTTFAVKLKETTL